MSRSRSVLVVLSVVVLTMLTGPVPASANVIVRTDGNDTRGPLDLASVRVTHAPGASVFRLTTQGRFVNRQVNQHNGLFEVDFDTNADRNANFYAVVFYRNGRMRGWLFKGNGDRITRTLTASRVNRRAVQVRVPLARIGNPKSYDFAAFTAFFATPCSPAQPCIDSIPNRYPLIRHDLTGPTFTWNPIPPVSSSDVATTLAFPVGFKVKDDAYGSGVKEWKLQRQEVGTSTWVDVKVGTKRAPTVKVTGVQQGKSYDLRVVVRDNQGNVTIGGVERTSVPYDDTNTSFLSYGGTWTPSTSAAQQFLGTASVGDTGADASFTVAQETTFCLLLGPTSPATTADVTVTMDAAVDAAHETDTTAPRERACFTTPGSASDVTVTLLVTSAEPFVLDGVVVLR